MKIPYQDSTFAEFEDEGLLGETIGPLDWREDVYLLDDPEPDFYAENGGNETPDEYNPLLAKPTIPMKDAVRILDFERIIEAFSTSLGIKLVEEYEVHSHDFILSMDEKFDEIYEHHSHILIKTLGEIWDDLAAHYSCSGRKELVSYAKSIPRYTSMNDRMAYDGAI